MDQAESKNQEFLRHIGKRCQRSDLDNNIGLCADYHHEETAQNKGQSLHKRHHAAFSQNSWAFADHKSIQRQETY